MMAKNSIVAINLIVETVSNTWDVQDKTWMFRIGFDFPT
jgi:hypothetical protein